MTDDDLREALALAVSEFRLALKEIVALQANIAAWHRDFAQLNSIELQNQEHFKRIAGTLHNLEVRQGEIRTEIGAIKADAGTTKIYVERIAANQVCPALDVIQNQNAPPPDKPKDAKSWT